MAVIFVYGSPMPVLLGGCRFDVGSVDRWSVYGKVSGGGYF